MSYAASYSKALPKHAFQQSKRSADHYYWQQVSMYKQMLLDKKSPNALVYQTDLFEYYQATLKLKKNKEVTHASFFLDYRAMEDAWNSREESSVPYYPMPKTMQACRALYLQAQQSFATGLAQYFDFLVEKASAQQLAYFLMIELEVGQHFAELMALAGNEVGKSGKQQVIKLYNYLLGGLSLSEQQQLLQDEVKVFMQDILKDIPVNDIHEVHLECMEKGNLLLMYATQCKYETRLVSVLGVMHDLMVRHRDKMVTAMRRVGFPAKIISFYQAQADNDYASIADWFDHMIVPLLKDQGMHTIKEVMLGLHIYQSKATACYDRLHKRMLKLL